MLLRDRGLTPEQVDACPAAFIDEVVAELAAANDHQLFGIKEPDTETARRQTRRKVELLHWRKAERDED